MISNILKETQPSRRTNKMATQLGLLDLAGDGMPEDPAYLAEQLITYIGNKRSLLPFIGQAVEGLLPRTKKNKPSFLDLFAGSGVVSRYFKQYASHIIANDLEPYAGVIGRCYLANAGDIDFQELQDAREKIEKHVAEHPVTDGFIRRLYAPKDDQDIQPGERVFYSVSNAMLLDSYRSAISTIDPALQDYFLGPLLGKASVHANTSGVFKGFYKDRETGIGCFGGRAGDALKRILGRIDLPLPVFSRFACSSEVHSRDANKLVRDIDPVDIAYLDPPYNQHPYGSNYFMLNLLLSNKEPTEVSNISGIPVDWNRSDYNSQKRVISSFSDLISHIKAKFILVSYNDEGFIKPDVMQEILERRGRVEKLEQRYNTFRGSRNLDGRSIYVHEQLFVVDCT